MILLVTGNTYLLVHARSMQIITPEDERNLRGCRHTKEGLE